MLWSLGIPSRKMEQSGTVWNGQCVESVSDAGSVPMSNADSLVCRERLDQHPGQQRQNSADMS